MTAKAARPCEACGVLVLDLVSTSTGRPAPIEVHPTPGGNILADLLEGTYVVVARADLEAVRANPVQRERLRINHYVNCPSAAAYRAKSKAK